MDLWREGSSFVRSMRFADHPQDLDIPASLLHAYERVPGEAFAMYGSRHFDDYHALLTLSDALGFQGIEHHQSSDNRAADDFLTDPDAIARRRRSDNARVFAFVERKIPPPRRSHDAELSSPAADGSALGVRRNEPISRRCALVSLRHSPAEAISRISCHALCRHGFGDPGAPRRR